MTESDLEAAAYFKDFYFSLLSRKKELCTQKCGASTPNAIKPFQYLQR